MLSKVINNYKLIILFLAPPPPVRSISVKQMGLGFIKLRMKLHIRNDPNWKFIIRYTVLPIPDKDRQVNTSSSAMISKKCSSLVCYLTELQPGAKYNLLVAVSNNYGRSDFVSKAVIIQGK